MRLLRAQVRNFKLLENVELEFSTQLDRPLTVIRAENGSGKTSLLYAFQWAFHGMAGLPDSARKLRLTSKATPSGQTTTVSVTIWFEVEDEHSNTARYRLIRSVIETPFAEDAFDRQQESIRLLKLTPRGDEEITPAEAWINVWLPEQVHEVFFTDGDAVQTFISGQIGPGQRQRRVHTAIRDLLDIDRFRIATEDIETAFRSLQREAAKSGGKDTSDLEYQLEETSNQINLLKADLSTLRQRLANMTDDQTTWDKELRGLSGFGDIDELNERIERIKQDQIRLEHQRMTTLVRMREELKSEQYSWQLMNERLQDGIEVLSDLADRRIIPGASIEILRDRLDLYKCICGESLVPGTEHRRHVEHLVEEQLGISEKRQRLTELFHLARRAQDEEQSRRTSGQAFASISSQLLAEFMEIRDSLRDKGLELRQLEARRDNIDEERVRNLTWKIQDVNAKIAKSHEDIGSKKTELEQADKRHALQAKQFDDALKQAAISNELVLKRDVAQDLTKLAKGVLEVLEGDYVQRVSKRMRDLFMKIVGAPDDPLRKDFGSVLFAGVHIDDDFNIIIDTHDGRRLDPDFELNGASKRALTLSFIWALMEVSDTTAPRMIDTPLGMVSGGVKSRMLDAVTQPPTDGLPAFQVILFLTRSELRDVEDLIDERAGNVMTLSCSEHYPADLTHPWNTHYPVSRICLCDHRHSCRTCARHYDKRHGVTFQDTERAV